MIIYLHVPKTKKKLYFCEAEKVLYLFFGVHDSLVFYFSLTIVVTFSRIESDRVLIMVDVSSEGAEDACNHTLLWRNGADFEWKLCSEKDKPETCEELCGVGTGRAIPVINGM